MTIADLNSWLLYLACAALGYLLGNVQFAVIISRLKYKDDVRNHGSGNAGSTNMLRVFGLSSGLITFLGDLLKGILGVLIGRWIAGEVGGYICALFVVLGHDFPVFLRFKGGKGVAWRDLDDPPALWVGRHACRRCADLAVSDNIRGFDGRFCAFYAFGADL